MIQTLLAIASINIIWAMSPWPDFVVVTKNSLMYGRKHWIATAAWISTANITYCLLVAGWLWAVISQSVLLFQMIKIWWALYLIYLAYWLRKENILSPDRRTTDTDENDNTIKEAEIQQNNRSLRSSYKDGFITNITNPKFIVFLLSLYAQFFTVDTPMMMYLLSGAVIAITAGIWFGTLSIVIWSPTVQHTLERYQWVIQKVLWTALGLLGVKILIE